jgi:hypothetical protein
MRRIVSCLGFSLLLALPLNAQQDTAPVQVCIASAECFGAACAQRKVVFPERELLTKKLNAGPGTPKLEARDEGYRPRPGCGLPVQNHSCDYLVLVDPVEVSRSVPLSRLQTEAERLAPVQAPGYETTSPNARIADERQQEPLDQSSLRFHVIRLRGCRQVESRELKKLETTSAAANAATMEWLTSRAAERVRKAIEKDMRTQPVAKSNRP